MRLSVVPRSLLLVCALSVSGCTYVTNADWVEKTDCLDEDEDGAVRSASCSIEGLLEDCEDDRADRAPDLEEIPYDGIDNDCNGLEIVDVDNDGYPGVLEADWVANDDSTQYPSVESQLLDCDDNDGGIRPNAGETFYDGIDSNCDNADDWDADGDGYVIRADLLPAGALAYDGLLPGGDCDDAAAGINPGITTDPLFDGIDSNCDAVNEFDGDGDTWMDAGDVAEFNGFVQRFGYEGRFPENFGDCDDNDITIFDGAPDPFYDGIDSNCDLADDFDQDLDGLILNQNQWPDASVTYSGTLPQGDCNDQDPTVLPGALEILGDSIDQDCDGGADTAPIQFWANNAFDGPRPPVVGGMNGMYVLVVASDSFNSTPNTGLAIQFPWETPAAGGPDVPPATDAQPATQVFWEFSGDGAFSAQIDAEFDDDRFFVGASHLISNNFTLKNQIRIYRHTLLGNGSLTLVSARDGFGSTQDMYTGLDLEIDINGDIVLGACSQDVAHFKIAEEVGANFRQVLDLEKVFDTNTNPMTVGNSCFVEPRQPLVRPTNSPLESRADLLLRAFGPNQHNLEIDSSTDEDIISDGPDGALTGFTVNNVVQRNGIAALTGSNPGGPTPFGVTLRRNGVATGAYLQTEEVFWASATELDGDLYMAAVVEDNDSDGSNDIAIVYGNPSNPTIAHLPILTPDGTAINAEGVSLWVDEDRVFIGVTGTVGLDDYVGWVFLAPAQ
ncbi:MAG: hypothetical protein ACJAZO_002918 [Myxococcota bacterium]|jgi:hypothetical protein